MSYSKNIINHTKIAVTSKKTGETKVLLQTKEGEKDPHITGAIAAGIPITECADDSLDTLTFTVMNSGTKSLFKPFDVVTFAVDDGATDENGNPVARKYEMCVLSDHAETQSQINNTYKHTVACIESTKILEKVKIFNLNLTNPNDSLFMQFDKALTNAEPLVSTYDKNGNEISRRERRFEPTEELKTFLGTIPGEDFRFNNTDLRSVLDGILATCNARAEVKEIIFENKNIKTIKIGYRSLTEVQKITPEWAFEKHGKILKEELENYAQDAAGKIVARGYNTVMSKPVTFTDTFKSDTYNVNSNNATIFLPFPISDKGIVKFAVTSNVSFEICIFVDYRTDKNRNDRQTKNGIVGAYLPVDLTCKLIPQEYYDVLSDEEKQEYIPYTIGSTTINASGVKKGFLYQVDKVKSYIESYAFKQYGNSEAGKLAALKSLIKQWQGTPQAVYIPYATLDQVDICDVAGANASDWINRSFTITYYPIIDTATEVTKAGVYDKDEILLGIADSQTENTLDQTRHGKQLQGLINRTGNDEYYIDIVAKSFNSLLPLRAQCKDYVVYKKECGVYDKFVKCRYYLSKNFNALQKVAGVNREKHLFDIPLESDECPIIVKKYMVFGSEQVKGESGDKRLINNALGTIVKNNVEEDEFARQKVNYMSVVSYMDSEQFPRDTTIMKEGQETSPYKNNEYVMMLPCMSYGQAKQMNFISRPLDNYSMGYSRNGYVFSVWGDGGNMITHTCYVSRKMETAGECDKFELSLVCDHSTFNSPHISATDLKNAVQELPVADKTKIICAEENKYEIKFFKDRTQKPVFCESIECVPAENDFGKIFIGNAFCKDNNLVQDNGIGLKGLRLVGSTSKTFDGTEEFIPLINEFSDSLKNYFDVGVGNVAGDINFFFNLTDEGLIYTQKYGTANKRLVSWAIVNDKGEIYLAVNGVLRDIYVGISDFPDEKKGTD